MTENQKLQIEPSIELERLYEKTLEDYVSGAGEGALQIAYELGRTAIANGLGVLQTAAMHHTALSHILLREHTNVSLQRDLERAGEFFGESLAAYEMTHRGYHDAISALHRLNGTLEQEIQRIAHAVHDEAGQLLVAAHLAMSAVPHDQNPAVGEKLKEVGAILDQVEKQLRRLSHELRPTILDDLGLVPALRFLADSVSKRSGLSVRVETTFEGRCPPNIETAIYRIVQEGLTNVTRHANARNATIYLNHVVRDLHCVVQDDGIGFDVSAVQSCLDPAGLGLVGIRERLNEIGGTMQLDSKMGRGTGLIIRIPMER